MVRIRKSRQRIRQMFPKANSKKNRSKKKLLGKVKNDQDLKSFVKAQTWSGPR